MSQYCTVTLLLLTVLCFASGLSEKAKNEKWVDKYETETKDQMLADARPEPTPAICPHKTTCGMQPYDDATTGNHDHPYVHYCYCPEGLECLYEGRNMGLRYDYYRCKNRTEEESSTESSVNVSSVSTEDRSERPSSSKRFGYVNEEL